MRTRRRRSDVSIDSVRSPWKRKRLQRRSCGDHVHSHCSPGVPVALSETSVCCYCASTATPRRSYRAHSDRSGNAEPRHALCACPKSAPWHGVQGDPTASSGDVTAMPRHSSRSHCTHLGVLKFSRTPCNRREDAALVWQGLNYYMTTQGTRALAAMMLI